MQKLLKARTILDAVLAAITVLLLSHVLIVAFEVADRKATIRRVTAEAQTIYDAFALYYDRNGEFPDDADKSRFDRVSLDPLRRRGYYRGSIDYLLIDRKADGYDSPDDRGANQEFWLEMTLAGDPRVRLLVVRSDDAPLGGGQWRDGAFIVRKGQLEPL
jgi:hypothetical protein